MDLKIFHKPLNYLALTVLLATAAAAGYGIRNISAVSDAVAAPSAANATQSPRQTSIVTLPDFAEIASKQGPAVVNISVSGTVKTGFSGYQGVPQMDPGDPFYDFFRRFQAPAPHNNIPTHGLGSGFIVSADGVVLTNAHVVSDADEVIVKLIDKREFKAKVIGIDKLSDVAVLKIDAENLPTVKIGDPQESRVGEWVVAIGSPFGFENTVTAGIISAKSRSLPDEGFVPFLQTDVAVNPGNSGGPLFNMNGEVIGINSQIFSRSGGYQGLSFAIPISVAMNVERQILDHGTVNRGRLGVMIQEVNQQLADTFGLSKPAGALVSSVEKDSPAEKAGIKPGDVILEFNDKEIIRSTDLPSLVSELSPGSEANLKIWRKNKAREISMKVGAMKVAGAKATTLADASREELGLAVRPLTAEERNQADVSGGLLVEDVAEGAAARAGIRSGDVILSVNGEKTNSIAELRAITGGKKRIAVLVLRGEMQMFVPIDLG